MLKAYWEGKRELFEGLAITELSKDDPEAFEPHPVLYFDLNKDNYREGKGVLENVLDRHLISWEEEYGIEAGSGTLAARFQRILETAFEQTGRPVAVLVDEYDKCMLEVLTDKELDEHIETGNLDGIHNALTSLYAQLPYTTDEKPREQDFQNVLYIVFTMLGRYVKTEVHSSRGRADVIVETYDHIYIFEFKRDKSADEALQQIEDKGYDKPYAADKRTLYKIGVNFNSETRELDGWKVAT